MSSAVSLFIVVALLMVVLVLAWIGPGLFSAPGVRAGPDRKSTSLDVYRDELAQLLRDRECGRLSEQAFEEARQELGRRLLDEANDQDDVARMRLPARSVGLLVMLMVPFLAAGIYAKVGSWNALSAVESGMSDREFYQSLQTHLQLHPEDSRAWVALARYEMEVRRFNEAAAAFDQARSVSPKVAGDANILCELAEAVGMAQGGKYRGRPQQLVEEAMALEPNNPLVLEMAGGAAYEARDYNSATRYWKILRAMMDADSPAYADISAAISHAEAQVQAQLAEQQNFVIPGSIFPTNTHLSTLSY